MTVQQAPSALTVRDLRVHFKSRKLFRSTEIRAVDGVSLDVAGGETLGLVGESGSGKTTVGRTIVRLVKPESGSIDYGGHDVLGAKGSELRELRSKIQFVFQDPYHSLNPTQTIEQMLTEPLKVHFNMGREERVARAVELLEQVGLASYHLKRKPIEFSGGQRQRLAIARALAMKPQLLVCDEPVSALDVSTQSQVINLLESLQQDLGLSYLFISHDLAVVRHASHRIAVLYRGRMAEIGPAEAVCTAPGHPYTARLLSAIPFANPDVQAIQREQRKVYSVKPQARTSTGCPFAPRCPHVMERCWTETPPMYRLPSGAEAACFLHAEGNAPDLLYQTHHAAPEDGVSVAMPGAVTH